MGVPVDCMSWRAYRFSSPMADSALFCHGECGSVKVWKMPNLRSNLRKTKGLGSLKRSLVRTGKEFLKSRFIGVDGATNIASNTLNASFQVIDVESPVTASKLLVFQLRFVCAISFS